jgi:hypothetical protein
MSDKLASAFSKYPNLAERALTMLLQDPDIAVKVEDWIIEQSKRDVRFSRLGSLAGLPVGEWVELARFEIG